MTKEVESGIKNLAERKRLGPDGSFATSTQHLKNQRQPFSNFSKKMKETEYFQTLS